MSTRRAAALIFAAAALALCQDEVGSARVKIDALPPLPGGTYSVAYGICASGRVAGASQMPDGRFHATAWLGREAQDLGTLPGGTDSFGRAVLGPQVVGESLTDAGSGRLFNHAFIHAEETMLDLAVLSGASSSTARSLAGTTLIAGTSDTPEGLLRGVRWKGLRGPNATRDDADYSLAFGINTGGTMAGRYSTGEEKDGTVRFAPARFQGSRLLPLRGLRGSKFATAYAINTRGVAVGESETGKTDDLGFRTRRAVAWRSSRKNARPTALKSLPGEAVSCAYGIDPAGKIVGYSATAGGELRATLWRGNKVIDLNTLLPKGSGWNLQIAYGINAANQVCGQGRLNGQPRAFRLRLP
ncbi:MAG: hypothetical protein ACK47B_08090 [Armatimonadota bacterium]